MTDRLSACCGAYIVVAGKGMTHWYACGECGEAIVESVAIEREQGESNG